MIAPQETEDVQSFERRSKTYEDSFRQGFFFDRVHRTTLDSIPAGFKPESILDIGCGTGRLLRRAATRWPTARLIGVDPSEGMVTEARRLTPGAIIHHGLAESLPIDDESVNLVLSTASFHHWQDQAQGLKQIARVLRPGGFFVLADISMPYGLQKIYRHGRQADPSTLGEMASQAGLTIQAQRRVLGRFLLVAVGGRAR
jgi:ubiquinone/menaquinone biosynthesis C-methylase UbiE